MIDGNPRSATRAVLDTSVLFSEHRHWLWLLARLGYYDGIWSIFIVAELVRIRVEHSIRLGVARSVYRQRINDLIHLLTDALTTADYRDVPVRGGALTDPDDEPILSTAIAGSAELIVSLNTRDFPIGGRAAGVEFLTPRDFLNVLIARHPDADLERRVQESGGHVP